MYDIGISMILAEGVGKVVLIAGLIVVGIVLLIAFLLIANLIGLWIQAYFARANINLVALIGMRLRKVNPRIIVKSKIMGI